MKIIKEIKQAQLIDIRHKILRPDGSVSECYFPADKNLGVFHLGLYKSEILVTICSLYPENNINLKNFKNAYRLRGMATLVEYQSKGLGSEILLQAITNLKDKGADLLWCNARTSALEFYKRNGFKVHGSEFEITGVGAHYICYLPLITSIK